MELQDIDLNLLVVFNELLRQRKMSAVARTLGISQPAVSNALNRLRKLLDDDLFLRTSKGMIPTQLAGTLAGPITEALDVIHHSLNARATFDPLTSTRAFTVAMTDIGEIYLLPGLMERLGKLAPGVKISTVCIHGDSLKGAMESGCIDLAIGFLPGLTAGFFQRRLLSQQYVCIFRKGHPLGRRDMTLEAFAMADRVSISAEGTGHTRVDAAIQQAGVTRRSRLSVPHFAALGHILQSTDLIAVVPQAYAERALVLFNLVSAPCPVKISEISVNVFWHATRHREVGNQWLRNVISDRFAVCPIPEATMSPQGLVVNCRGE
ncbi:DNA-binding transcriptional LysR family regulator [Cupriavidus metallidurans]|jgi:DNA-binding transcriptional LysR family regulator|uniref:Transcriptional regulator, LysR family n=1 Tax=Cupriavidus metallidurans (strain ATCC 43123 / DSM 2839 / NBRC 102507 / CH34) TaxID=266264 RepID=Q1LGZ1_CUPMC|nr:LysR family transcriptional regulator [Cupriavidus metallidurans]ABF10585.1 transcriptional regulator, LysR family [Cupriavidus metallidurans CH34]AVA35540.1 LysR family transcriptional regulator [Cupriavidus metallidurans]KWW35352.1 PCP degradation transcriptional activation protein [Cupriavidus metallidurans]MDE4921498.1 LysR family transcriptional regulator [Cupriavidus metallidurans]QGS31938.1 LysR family transcriptional regulator [Cupriavidus metallidurans]